MSAITELGKAGVVSVFAAGNDSLNLDTTPNLVRATPYSITVGAANDSGNVASFSNYGKNTVDVFAPGTSILGACSGESVQYLP